MKVMHDIQERLKILFIRNTVIKRIVQDIANQDGVAYLVGGAVRDLVAGLPLKDIDIEVHNMTLDTLSEILQEYAPVSYVGKVYGVLKLHDDRYHHIDWSIPRRDTAGRKPDVQLDPHMDLKQALIRRDLTINAMALNMHSGELNDPFNGYADLSQRRLRAPDPDFFLEDPLRFYRVMQFIGRFNTWPDAELDGICKEMDVSQVSRERIDGEFEKLLLKSERPSRAFYWLSSIGRLYELLPELARLQGVPQSVHSHPEGDVFTHTMQVLDATAYSVVPAQEDQLVLRYAALCHDLGKPEKTEKTESGKITSHGHEKAGIEPTKQLLSRITGRNTICKKVPRLVADHMAPGIFGRHGTGVAKYKKLAAALGSEISLYLLAVLCYADHRGRNGYENKPLAYDIPAIDTFIETARSAGVLHTPEKRVVSGKDFLDTVEEGPKIGKLVDAAYHIQITENIHDKETLKRRAYAQLKQEEAL